MVAPAALAARAASSSCSRALHGAGPGDQSHVPASQAGASHGDHGVGAPELPAHQLVGPQDGQHLVHARVRLQRQPGDHVPLPHDPDHGHHVAGGDVPLCPRALQPLQDALDVLRRRAVSCITIIISVLTAVHINSPGSAPQRSDRLTACGPAASACVPRNSAIASRNRSFSPASPMVTRIHPGHSIA